MRLISPNDWRPKGISDLEPNAWQALRRTGSTCVVAGPGAGKTEFLAQRAAYLLETGLCPLGRRILAISFKSDAAANLAQRVQRRCRPELADRFTSLTFDAFTKGLVDRFLPALPEHWRPTRPYEVWFPTQRQVVGHLTDTRQAAPAEWRSAIAGIPAPQFEARYVGETRLPLEPPDPTTGEQLAVIRWLLGMIGAHPASKMSFVALNRLAELLLRQVPHIRRGLQATYPFVFVDEFQDTTYAQYDFLLSAFAGADISLTAVGDDKQRIMTWAGARPDAFTRVQMDFAAASIPLLFNFRSSPDLVAIQHVVAQALDPQAPRGISKAERVVDGDVAQVWCSDTTDEEAHYLASWLAEDMAERGLAPRDYVVLVKQRADQFEAQLASRFEEAGLRLRNEAGQIGRTTLQDLLADHAALLAANLLRLGASKQAPRAYEAVLLALRDLRGIPRDDDRLSQALDRELSARIKQLRLKMAQIEPCETEAQAFTHWAFGYLDLAALRRTHPEYRSGDLLDIMVEAFGLHLGACSADSRDWNSVIDRFDGLGQIPLMTVHKSKGLEFDTTLFVGLDDNAWWSHAPGDPESVAAFFVALSRAKQRAIFAFCRGRGRRNKVADLFQLLTDAGVPEVQI